MLASNMKFLQRAIITFIFRSFHTGDCAGSLRDWEQLLLRKCDRLKGSGFFESCWLFLSSAIFCSTAVGPASVGIRYTDVVCKS